MLRRKVLLTIVFYVFDYKTIIAILQLVQATSHFVSLLSFFRLITLTLKILMAFHPHQTQVRQILPQDDFKVLLKLFDHLHLMMLDSYRSAMHLNCPLLFLNHYVRLEVFDLARNGEYFILGNQYYLTKESAIILARLKYLTQFSLE